MMLVAVAPVLLAGAAPGEVLVVDAEAHQTALAVLSRCNDISRRGGKRMCEEGIISMHNIE